jgi:hypothetical protein
MEVPDVNILVNAFRRDAPDHAQYRAWLEDLINGDAAYGVVDPVLSGFVRIVTNPKIFAIPSPLDPALDFAEAFRSQPPAIHLFPGRRHWEVFTNLCRRVGARGNIIPDAWLAAMAIESGYIFVTADRGFGRFPGLRWRHPFD